MSPAHKAGSLLPPSFDARIPPGCPNSSGGSGGQHPGPLPRSQLPPAPSVSGLCSARKGRLLWPLWGGHSLSHSRAAPRDVALPVGGWDHGRGALNRAPLARVLAAAGPTSAGSCRSSGGQELLRELPCAGQGKVPVPRERCSPGAGCSWCSPREGFPLWDELRAAQPLRACGQTLWLWGAPVQGLLRAPSMAPLRLCVLLPSVLSYRSARLGPAAGTARVGSWPGGRDGGFSLGCHHLGWRRGAWCHLIMRVVCVFL